MHGKDSHDWTRWWHCFGSENSSLLPALIHPTSGCSRDWFKTSTPARRSKKSLSQPTNFPFSHPRFPPTIRVDNLGATLTDPVLSRQVPDVERQSRLAANPLCAAPASGEESLSFAPLRAPSAPIVSTQQPFKTNPTTHPLSPHNFHLTPVLTSNLSSPHTCPHRTLPLHFRLQLTPAPPQCVSSWSRRPRG